MPARMLQLLLHARSSPRPTEMQKKSEASDMLHSRKRQDICVSCNGCICLSELFRVFRVCVSQCCCECTRARQGAYTSERMSP